MSGHYSVRSGYKLLLQIPNVSPFDRHLFKKICVFNCPPKIRFALWKCVRAFIPTKVSLFAKRIAFILSLLMMLLDFVGMPERFGRLWIFKTFQMETI